MKYGTLLIAVAVINVITIFSGIPTGWKKVVIIATGLICIGIGWILRTLARRKAERVRARAVAAEVVMSEEIAEVADEIARDIAHQVTHDVDDLTGLTK